MYRTAAQVRLPNLSNFARCLLAEWKRLDLSSGDGGNAASVIVGVSGGADSTALLFALAELVQTRKLNISVIPAHLNHSLRGCESDADAGAVRDFAARLGIDAVIEKVDVAGLAERTRDNLEQAGRKARYDFFARIARQFQASHVALAHTMDDQAETVLLRLMRGSAAHGLAAMLPVRAFPEAGNNVNIIRPLLSWARRVDTEAYCRDCTVDFRVDATNLDERLSRVRVRRQLLPLMQTFNPAIVETLARTAVMLGEDSRLLDAQAAVVLHAAERDEAQNQSAGDTAKEATAKALSVEALSEVPRAMRRRVLRLWIAGCLGHTRRIETKNLAALETLLDSERGGRVIELPGGSRVVRRKGFLYFLRRSV